MFDSLIDAKGDDWQTKAFECELNTYRIGDAMPGPIPAYQVEVLGGGGEIGRFIDSLATVRDGVLASIPDVRDEHLALIHYFGGIIAAAKEA